MYCLNKKKDGSLFSFNSWSLSSYIIKETGGNKSFIGDYFQGRINTHLVL